MTDFNPLWHKALSVFIVLYMSFLKIVIFRKDIHYIRYIIALFGLFSCVSVGLVYSSSLHLYSCIWCWCMYVGLVSPCMFLMIDYATLFLLFLLFIVFLLFIFLLFGSVRLVLIVLSGLTLLCIYNVIHAINPLFTF